MLKRIIICLFMLIIFSGITTLANAEETVYLSHRKDISNSITKCYGSIEKGSNQLFINDNQEYKAGYGIAIRYAGNNQLFEGWLITEVVEVKGNILILKDNAANSVSGTDVYHDDSAAINRAIQDAAGTVIFDIDGVYASQIKLESNKKYLGKNECLIFAPLYLNQIKFIMPIISINDVSNITVDGLTIENGKYRGVNTNKMLGASSITISDSDRITISDNTLMNNNYVAVQMIGRNTNISVKGNKIIDTDVGVEALPQWQGSMNLDNIIIENNYIEGGTSEGISVESGMYRYLGSYAKNIKIINNYITGKESTAINYGSRTLDSEICGNTIKNCLNGITTRDRCLEPLQSLISNNISINGNQIDNCTWMGINVEGETIEIKNNNFSNMVESLIIGELTTVKNTTIDNNSFVNCSVEYGHNIILSNAVAIDITNNKFYVENENVSGIGIVNENVSDIDINNNELNDGMRITISNDIIKLANVKIENNTLGCITYLEFSKDMFDNLGLILGNNVCEKPDSWMNICLY